MRVVRAVVGVLGDVLVTAGLLLLLFVGWQLWWTDVTANRDQSGTVQALARDFGASPAPSPAPTRTTPARVPLGTAFAIVPCAGDCGTPSKLCPYRCTS